jgi:hypothetical protein
LKSEQGREHECRIVEGIHESLNALVGLRFGAGHKDFFDLARKTLREKCAVEGQNKVVMEEKVSMGIVRAA